MLLLNAAALSAQAGCIESADMDAFPVQCYSFRNGRIQINSVTGGLPPYYYSIDGSTFSTRSEFDLLWPGNYTVTIRDSLGCEWAGEIAVEEPPVLEIDLVASKTLVAIGETFSLSAFISPPGSIVQSLRWRPQEYFEDGNKLHQTVAINDNTTFAIEVTNAEGCTARDQVTVEVERPNVYVPNIILIGSNEDAYFTVYSDEFVRQVRRLQVFSRNGGLVFERTNFQTNDPLLGWNGRWNDRKVQEGVYAWIAEIEYLNGSIHTTSGSLTVIR